MPCKKQPRFQSSQYIPSRLTTQANQVHLFRVRVAAIGEELARCHILRTVPHGQEIIGEATREVVRAFIHLATGCNPTLPTHDDAVPQRLAHFVLRPFLVLVSVKCRVVRNPVVVLRRNIGARFGVELGEPDSDLLGVEPYTELCGQPCGFGQLSLVLRGHEELPVDSRQIAISLLLEPAQHAQVLNHLLHVAADSIGLIDLLRHAINGRVYEVELRVDDGLGRILVKFVQVGADHDLGTEALGVRDHLGQVGVQERLAPVVEVQLCCCRPERIDHLPKGVHAHAAHRLDLTQARGA